MYLGLGGYVCGCFTLEHSHGLSKSLSIIEIILQNIQGCHKLNQVTFNVAISYASSTHYKTMST